jgi:hypothetical protein
MPPTVGYEVPCRYEHKRGAIVPVSPAELREIHVFADSDTPPSGRLVPDCPLSSNGKVAFINREHVMFLICTD